MAKRTGRGFGHDPHGKVIFNMADAHDGAMLAYALLDPEKWPAMCVLTTTRVDGAGGLTTAECQTLYARQWDMAVHCYTHVDPTGLPDDADGVAPWDVGSLHEQLYEGLAFLAGAGLDGRRKIYAPPFAMNQHVSDEAIAAGYHYAFFTDFGSSSRVPWPYTFQWRSGQDLVVTMEQIKGYLELIRMQPHKVVVLNLEHVVAPPAAGTETSTTRLAEIIQLMKDMRITPTTMTELSRRWR